MRRNEGSKAAIADSPSFVSRSLYLVLFGAALLTTCVQSVALNKATTEPLEQSSDGHFGQSWLQKNLLDEHAQPPISFVYGRQPSGEVLRNWTRRAETKRIDETPLMHEVAFHKNDGFDRQSHPGFGEVIRIGPTTMSSSHADRKKLSYTSYTGSDSRLI